MNAEQQYLHRWMSVYAPEDRVTRIDMDALAQHAHPVMYLNALVSPPCDARFILFRPTRFGAWLRGVSTLSHQACKLTFEIAGYEVITTEYGMLSNTHSWALDWLNAVVSRIPLLRQLCHYELWLCAPARRLVPRSLPVLRSFNAGGGEGGSVSRDATLPSVSIIMPCRNEEGTVEEAIRRMPALGSSTEIICVEGHSRDNTLRELHRVKDNTSHISVKVMVQSGKGKKNAVVEGCAQATGDILMIFDSDMTVRPEDMQAFYNALVAGHADLINGSRLLFPLEQGAMRGPNFMFNHIFAGIISHSGILGQSVSDTLCGTKVCWRRDYERSCAEHAWLWNLDPFGDFSWLFGIAMLGGKIKDLPVRYYARTYGAPLEGCFRYGLELLRILWHIGLVRIIRSKPRAKKSKLTH